MILKNLTRRNNTKQLVEYLFKQEKNDKPKPLLKHNMQARSIKGWAKEFDKNESLRLKRRVDNVKLNHTIISFSNKDTKHINEKLLKDITRQYIKIRGVDNQYLASYHTDRQSVHIHLIMSGVKFQTGESNRISKAQFKELKLNMDEYQRSNYPELKNSLPNHNKPLKDRITDKEYQFQNREGNLSKKQQLLETTESVYSKSKSLDNFISQIKTEGYEPYYRGGRLYGLEDESGKHYRFKTIGFDILRLEILAEQSKKEAQQLEELASLREAKSQVQELESEFQRKIRGEEKSEDSDKGEVKSSQKLELDYS